MFLFLSFIEIEIDIFWFLRDFLAEETGYYFDILKYFSYFARSVFGSLYYTFSLFSRCDGFGENLFCFSNDGFFWCEGEWTGE